MFVLALQMRGVVYDIIVLLAVHLLWHRQMCVYMCVVWKKNAMWRRCNPHMYLRQATATVPIENQKHIAHITPTDSLVSTDSDESESFTLTSIRPVLYYYE